MFKKLCLIRNWKTSFGFLRFSSMSSNGKVRLAICQLNCQNDKEFNLQIGEQLIEKGKEENAQMIFFPEAFDFISPSKSLTIEQSESIDGPIITRYRQLAAQHRIWLSLGGFHLKCEDEKKIFNTHLIINDQGEIVSQYKKIHLFDIQNESTNICESDYTQSGSEIISPLTTPVGRIGLSICYDLRFPEMARLLTLSKENGAEILTYPSAFTKVTGQAHWEILLRCRAIENQCFVVAAAQVGSHGNRRESYGHSLIVDPWGKILVDLGVEYPAIKTIEIDLQLIEKIRREMPINEHRRSDLYQLNRSLTPLVEINDESDENLRWGQYEISSKQIFYRSQLSFATVNKKPVVRGHLLVSPIRSVQRFSQLNPEEISDLFLSTQRIAQQIEEFYQAKSLTIAIQDGKYAGQTVQHVHVHILPRREGDFESNDSVYHHLAHHDREETKWRSEDDMYEEAIELRKLFYH